MWKHKRPKTAKAIVNNKNDSGGITISGFKIYYLSVTVKTRWYWHKTDVNQWNRLETPENNPYTYNQLIFDKLAKPNLRKNNSFFNK